MAGGETTTPATTPDRITSATVKFDPKTVGRTRDEQRAFLRDRLFNHYGATLTIPEGVSVEEFKDFLARDWQFRIKSDPALAAELNGLTGSVIDECGEQLYYQILWDGKTVTPDEDPSARRHYQSGGGPTGSGAVGTGGDPINLFDGTFAYSTLDLALDGAGVDFRFMRSYSQNAAYNGPLGFKWDHSYNVWLQVGPGGNDITLSEGSLSLHRFRRHQVHNYFLPPDGRHAIIQETSTSFELLEGDGRRIAFRPHDTLDPAIHVADRVTDRFGNYLAFRYADGLLRQVEVNHPGRIVTFAYDTLSRITAVADFTGRTWRYAYDDLGDLALVTSPATDDHPQGLHTQYVYSTDLVSNAAIQHNLLRIVGADGRIYLENEYGLDTGVLSFNRVVRQRQGGGESIYDYADVIEDFDLPYAVAERPAHQTTVTSNDGRQTRSLFNALGNTILEETYARVNGLPTTLATHFRFNADGALIGTLSPLGAITQYLYGRDQYAREHQFAEDYDPAYDPNLTPAVRFGFGRLLASVQRMRYYDAQSLRQSSGLWSEDLLPDIYAVSPEDIIHKFAYEPELGQMLWSSDPRFTSSPDPNAVESADFTAHLTRYTYGPGGGYANGHLRSVALPRALDPDGNLAPEVTTHFTDYDPKGRLLRTVGPTGLEIINEYFGGSAGLREGFPRSMTYDPTGLAIRFAVERDQLGRPIRRFRPKYFDAQDGRHSDDTEFNSLGQVTKTTSTAPMRISQTFTYDKSGNPLTSRTELKDAAGVLTGHWDETNRYDDDFHLVRQLHGDMAAGVVRLTRATFDGAGRPSVSVPASGPKEKYAYNERGLKSRRTLDYARLRATTSFTYDADSRLIRRTDPGGHRTSYLYDPAGRGIEVTDPLGGKVISHHDKAGNLLVQLVFEPDGAGAYRLLARTENQYDALNRLVVAGVNRFEQFPTVPKAALREVFVTQGPGRLLKRRYWYTAGGRASRVEGYGGHSIQSEYDVLGRVTTTTDPLGNEVVFTYDNENQVTRIDRKEVTWDGSSSAILREQHFAQATAYDEMNRVAATTDSLGTTTRFDHDSRGNTVRVRGPLGTIAETMFDAFSRPVASTRLLLPVSSGEVPRTLTTLFDYDDADNLVSVTDPLGRVTRFVRDTLGRRISTVLPDGSADLIAYDRCGRTAETRDRNNVVCRYAHDAAHREVACEVDVAAAPAGLVIGGARRYAASYDGLGRTLSLENDFAHVQNGFDSLGLHVSETITHRNLPGIFPSRPLGIQRAFDDEGSLVRIAYPSGRTVAFDRDPIRRVTAIHQIQSGADYPGGPTTPDVVELARISYEGLRRSEISRVNGTITRLRHDVAGRPIQIEHRLGAMILLDARYLHDALGNVRNRDETVGGQSEVQTFMYDSLSRLRAVKDSGTRIDIDNLAPPSQRVPDPIPQVQAQIDQRIVAGATPVLSLEYDDVGNRVALHGPNGTRVYQPNATDQYVSADGKALTYDRSGNLLHQGDFAYGYDHRGRLTAVVNSASGHATALFSDAAGLTVAAADTEGTRLTIYDGYTPIEEYLNGQLVSSTIVDPAAGLPVVWSRGGTERFPYTDLSRSTRVVLDGTSSPRRYAFDPFGEPRQPVVDEQEATYTGKRRVPGTPLYDFTFRTYDPSLGRFLQRDPAGYGDGTNLYAYVGNNPMSYFDPLGLERQELLLGADIGADYASPPLNIHDPKLGRDKISTFYFDEQGAFLRWNGSSWVQDYTGVNAIVERAPSPKKSWLERYLNGVEGAVTDPYHFAKDRAAQVVDMATQGWAVLGKVTGGWDTGYTTWSSTSKAVEAGATRGQILWDATGGQVVNSVVGIGDLIIKHDPEMIGAVAGSVLLGGLVAHGAQRMGVGAEQTLSRASGGRNDFIPGYDIHSVEVNGRINRVQYFPETKYRVLDPSIERDMDLIDTYRRSESSGTEFGDFYDPSLGRYREVWDNNPEEVKIPLGMRDVSHTHPNGVALPSGTDMDRLKYSLDGTEKVIGRKWPNADRFLTDDKIKWPTDLYLETTYQRLPGMPKLIEEL